MLKVLKCPPPKYYNEIVRRHKITSRQINNSNILLLVQISVVFYLILMKKNLFNQKKFSDANSLFPLTDFSLLLREVRAGTQARTC